jgi:hypothetical protein
MRRALSPFIFSHLAPAIFLLCRGVGPEPALSTLAKVTWVCQVTRPRFLASLQGSYERHALLRPAFVSVEAGRDAIPNARTLKLIIPADSAPRWKQRTTRERRP